MIQLFVTSDANGIDQRRLLPQGVNPIDPQLMDRDILAGRVRLNIPADEWDGESDEETETGNRRRRRRHADQGEHNWIQGGANRRGGTFYNIDLNLPLLQLFLATFLPWVIVE